MPKATLIFGTILVTLGVLSYGGAWLAGNAHWTAFIPGFIGILFQILGLVGYINDRVRMHAMHVAAVLAVVTVLGTLRGVFQTISLFGGADLERPGAAIVQAITALLAAGFLVLCVQSFLMARMKKAEE